MSQQKRQMSTASFETQDTKRAKPSHEENNDSDEKIADEKHTRYAQWAQNQGISITSVAPLPLSGRGIGLLAITQIKADDKLIIVPEQSMIKTSLQFLKTNKLQKASPQAQLAAYLTLASRQTPEPPEWYVQSRAVWPTPEDFRACMVAWSEVGELDVLKECAPPSILSPLERLLLDLRKDEGAVEHLRIEAETQTGADDENGGEENGEGEAKSSWTEEYVYHWILVNTRSFHWKPHGVREGSMVMCPFLDYMNHCPNGHGCTVSVSTKGYELKANKSYDPGDEILAAYGAHPNDKLLVHYGFILEDSPDDEIRLDHVILPRLSQSQQSILQDVGFLGGYVLDPGTSEICFKTQVAVRSVLLTANEWEHYMGSGEDLASDKDTEVIEWLRPALEDYVDKRSSQAFEIACK
ncbi:hypothetical protein BDV97DRAFT_402455 [Delphinella strobiligena]|nr:hypothetical protein BDV97DRAFT_402455 [Delphinella strobiligena]